MDRAEAIEVLNFYRNCHYTEPLGTEERELADAINEILPHYAALREQEQSKWISVKERLPEDERSVLAYYGFGHNGTPDSDRMFTGVLSYFCFDPEPHWQHAGHGLAVTHWRPLPEPPKEGAEG